MTQYNTLNLSNSQVNKLKSITKKCTEVTLKVSSNVAAHYNDKNNFSQKLQLTHTRFSRFRKVFKNGS